MSTTTDSRPISVRARWISRRRVILLGLALPLLLLGCWCGLFIRGALTFKSHLDEFQGRLSGASASGLDVQAIRRDVTTLRSDLRSLQSSGGVFLSLAPHLGWLPGIGRDVQAAPELLGAAIDFLDAGTIALDAVAPIWPPRAVEGQSGMTVMLQGLVGVLPQLDIARAPLQRAVDRLARIDVERLSPALRVQLERLTPLLPMAESGFELLDMAPTLLGFERPKTYIVLLQNEDELRPTGGFISSVARVTFDRGAIIELDVRDSYEVDDYLNKPYGDPPVALTEFMGAELWLFRDANWSPDFPTSARRAAELYTYGLGVPVDGVVGLNQRTVQNLIGALGPIEVEPGRVVDVSNLTQYMHESWSPLADTQNLQDWIDSRKDFVGRLAHALLTRVQETPADLDWLALGRAVFDSLESRDLLVWVAEARVSAILEERGWNGALKPVVGDYWMVVDTNVGFNKANAAVETSIVYDVVLHTDGSARAELRVTYEHMGLEADGCPPPAAYSLDVSYDALIQRCYWNYMRVLVPTRAQLLHATSHPAQADYLVSGRQFDGRTDVSAEAGHTVMGTLFVLERGRSLERVISYDVPSVSNWSASSGDYRLTIQKQSGVEPRRVMLKVSWPEGYTLVQASLPILEASERSATFGVDLGKDLVVVMNWSK